MDNKINKLLSFIKGLSNADIDRVLEYVIEILKVNNQQADRPGCPHCGSTHIIKNGHKDGKQRFLCHDCGQSYMRTTNTLMDQSHYTPSVWSEFIKDTLRGASLDYCSEKFGFSHQTAFNMRHKFLLALQDFLKQNPVTLSGVSEFDETFVLESNKGTKFTADSTRKPRRHGARAASRGISSEWIAICTGIQRDGGAIACTVNRAKPSKEELASIFAGSIQPGTLALTDGLRSYNVLKELGICTVVEAYKDEDGFYNLNTVNSMHSYIKDIYDHYRGVATKYINRYNAMFSLVFRSTQELSMNLFSSLCNTSTYRYWHSVEDVKQLNLTLI